MFPIPSLLDELEARNRAAIRTIADGMSSCRSVQDALAGNAIRAAEALGCVNTVQDLMGSSIGDAMASMGIAPKNLGLGFRSAFGGVIK